MELPRQHAPILDPERSRRTKCAIAPKFSAANLDPCPSVDWLGRHRAKCLRLTSCNLRKHGVFNRPGRRKRNTRSHLSLVARRQQSTKDFAGSIPQVDGFGKRRIIRPRLRVAEPPARYRLGHGGHSVRNIEPPVRRAKELTHRSASSVAAILANNARPLALVSSVIGAPGSSPRSAVTSTPILSLIGAMRPAGSLPRS